MSGFNGCTLSLPPAKGFIRSHSAKHAVEGKTRTAGRPHEKMCVRVCLLCLTLGGFGGGRGFGWWCVDGDVGLMPGTAANAASCVLYHHMHTHI